MNLSKYKYLNTFINQIIYISLSMYCPLLPAARHIRRAGSEFRHGADRVGPGTTEPLPVFPLRELNSGIKAGKATYT